MEFTRSQDHGRGGCFYWRSSGFAKACLSGNVDFPVKTDVPAPGSFFNKNATRCGNDDFQTRTLKQAFAHPENRIGCCLVWSDDFQKIEVLTPGRNFSAFRKSGFSQLEFGSTASRRPQRPAAPAGLVAPRGAFCPDGAGYRPTTRMKSTNRAVEYVRKRSLFECPGYLRGAAKIVPYSRGHGQNHPLKATPLGVLPGSASWEYFQGNTIKYVFAGAPLESCVFYEKHAILES